MQPPISPKVLAARIRLASRHPTASMTADEIIEKALEYKVYLAWSGGRCSTVVLHMVLQHDPEYPVMFNNTGVEYPETVKYVREMAAKWDVNFTEMIPKVNFWDLVKEHGFPQLRGSIKSKSRPRKPACCKYLKEAPGKEYSKKNGMVGFMSGIRVEESRPRALGIYQKGVWYKAIRDGLWKFHPVALYSLDQLMAYVDKHDIPLNPLYAQGLPRVGCMPCTGFTYWRQQLKEVNYRYYKWLNREYQKWDGTPTLWEYENLDDCRQEPYE